MRDLPMTAEAFVASAERRPRERDFPAARRGCR